VVAVAFTNAQQDSGVIKQFVTATGNTSPITTTLTTASSDNMLVDGTQSVQATTITAASGQTDRGNQQYGTTGTVIRQGSSTRPATGASQTMSWVEGTTTRRWAQVVLELKAAPDVPLRQLALTGVGQ
jgi:hypothetical protein